jgi:hypothetical protein
MLNMLRVGILIDSAIGALMGYILEPTEFKITLPDVELKGD